MSAKRFDYLKRQPEASNEPTTIKEQEEPRLQSLPRGQGRMRQEREQLNVRLPTQLKRRAAAKAMLEGRTIGEVIEEMLQQYINQEVLE